jgi:hypothetical protein
MTSAIGCKLAKVLASSAVIGLVVAVSAQTQAPLAPPSASDRAAITPGFPAELVGVSEVHAAFLNESRTRGPVQRSEQEIRAAASAAERDRELKLLGITAMQPPATAYDIGNAGNANYDEAKANPYPKLPDVLTMNDGTKVTTPAQWKKRRAEIKAMFDENVYGKYPAHIPAVTWKVDSVEQMTVQGIPAIVKHITGHVDNSAYPAITVDIHADVVTPASTKGTKVPVIIGGGSIRPRPVSRAPLLPRAK